jgi:hypothetical protein
MPRFFCLHLKVTFTLFCSRSAHPRNEQNNVKPQQPQGIVTGLLIAIYPSIAKKKTWNNGSDSLIPDLAALLLPFLRTG